MNKKRRQCSFFPSISLLKSIEYPSGNEDSSKTFFEQNQPIKTEENQIKHSPHDSEGKSLTDPFI